ncbi:MAG: UDP-N-acetylmuramoyl-tripeptide--D-alanyl-D-alanine ligase [Gammaproteobacteria bacterium]
MMAMQLSEAAQVLSARQSGPNAEFSGVSTDSRSLEKGNLFVALRGPNFDGHAFLDEAWDHGAAAAAVSQPVKTTIPYLSVPDTRLALGELAHHWRKRFSLPVIGVTGSNGKTTVKELCAAILGCRGQVLVTKGNLNNEIGVPLTLFRLDPADQFAVVELGANHPGEIGHLTAIAHPTIGIITNAAAVHLQGFGSLEGVARSKGELLLGLASDGVAVINADDPFAPLWKELAGSRSIQTFGMSHGADVWGEWQPGSAGNRLHIRVGGAETKVTLSLPGRHNALNALAAAAACLAAGATLQEVKQGLQSVQPLGGRLCIHKLPAGVTVIDDTYNANPSSLQAALQVLAEGNGERWLVLGDMGELGEDAVELHRQAARNARAAGVTRLYALGDLAAEAAATFGQGGQAFSEPAGLLAELQADLRPGVVLLVKGSRAMAMERVLQAVMSVADEIDG